MGNEDSIVAGEKVLRYVSGFARAGLSTNNGDSVFSDGVDDLLFVFEDGQMLLDILNFS